MILTKRASLTGAFYIKLAGMDTLAHGLWGGAAFGRSSRKAFGQAFVLGMAPDLLSFGPAFATWAVTGFPRRVPGEPPNPADIPHYVYSAYNVTHSLVVWAAAFALVWRWRKKPPVVFLAWPLHILCDIPTHTRRFFPTPFLWPLPTP